MDQLARDALRLAEFSTREMTSTNPSVPNLEDVLRTEYTTRKSPKSRTSILKRSGPGGSVVSTWHLAPSAPTHGSCPIPMIAHCGAWGEGGACRLARAGTSRAWLAGI